MTLLTPCALLSGTRPVPPVFFARATTTVAQDLLGTILIHETTAGLLAGKIVEVEAYLGDRDPAAHSYRGMTERTRVLFGPPGHAYVYLNYGIHECLNFVTEPSGRPGCVLIRALEPLLGLEQMRRRRPKASDDRDLASGPGKLTQAMGISRAAHYGVDITKGALRVRRQRRRESLETGASPRIGISAARDLPLRFFVRGNQHVSRAKFRR